MTTPVVMPQLGETIVEGTVLRWLKAEGETVALDEPLFEISTDKVDTEVPSPVAGVLAKILVPEGQTVGVGTPLAEIAESTSHDGPAGGAPPVPRAAASHASASRSAPPPTRSAVVSPIVRRLAAEHHLDLSRITGTGAGGRVTRKDVEAYLASRDANEPAEPSIPTVERTVAPRGSEERLPMSHIRRQIAGHMVRSSHETARAWSMVEVDMESIARLREREKEDFKRREGYSLTYLPFVSRAVCEALLAFPMVNAELRGDEILLRHYVHLGIAVAYDEGLIVPVVKDADAMSLTGLARAIADLAKRARAKQLNPDEVHGATFTITNPGPFGSILSVPIINQPNTAILSLDAVERRPVVIDDAIGIRHRVYLSMSWDHRVIDGALASQFLARVKEHLETWDFAEDLGT